MERSTPKSCAKLIPWPIDPVALESSSIRPRLDPPDTWHRGSLLRRVPSQVAVVLLAFFVTALGRQS